MSDNGAKDNRRNGHNQTAIYEPDELLVCDGCNGRGKHCDQWGPWQCGLCHGLGYVTRSFWDAWVASFSPQSRHISVANLNRLCTASSVPVGSNLVLHAKLHTESSLDFDL